jgi:hypothetical protein
MKFIFPQNYNFNIKLFGFIDYQVAILNIILWVIIYFFINLIFKDLYLKIIIFISIAFPILLLSIIGFNHENILYVFMYIFKFIKNKRVYLYIKK